MLRGSDNARGTAPQSRFRGDPLAALDRLPPLIRRALHEALLPWSPLEERWHLNKMMKAGLSEAEAVERLVQHIRDADAREAAAMRHAWPARFGRCPAIAADATIMRYDEADRVRQGRA